MRIEDWLKAASGDATRRELPELVPLLESMAASTARLREADQVERASADDASAATGHLRPEPSR